MNKTLSFGGCNGRRTFAANMNEVRDIVCSTVRMVPHKYTRATSGRTFAATDTAQVVTLRGNARAQMERHVSHEDGGMVEELQLTLSFDNPELTALLRNRNLHWWVAELVTNDGDTLLFGSKDYPASLETNGTDTSDTITLTTKQPI